MISIVTALPGSGKSTTLKKLVELVPDVKVVNFGDFMFEEAASLYGIKHRDEMRSLLSLNDYQKLQVRAAERISYLVGRVVVDTHSVIKSPYGYYPGLPSAVVKTINPHLVFFIECRPEDILERRLKDLTEGAGRMRETAGLDEIAYDQEVGRSFVISAVNTAMCYLKIIRLNYPQSYPFQHALDAAKQIAQTMAEIESRGKV